MPARRSRLLAGLAFLALAVVLSPPGIGWLAGSAPPDEWSFRGPHWALAALSALAGLHALGPARAERTSPRAKILLAALGLGLPLAEVALRLGIAQGIPQLCRPDLYADPFTGDTYWQLVFRWNPEYGEQIDTSRFHPTLGWAPAATDENPLGVIADGPYEVDPTETAILVFGDSFIEGTTAIEERLPQQLDTILRKVPVWNFGVAGYGAGQIRERFREVLPLFERPVCVVGLFSRDVDRTPLSLRTGPKPFWRLAEGRTVRAGLPIEPPDPELWLRANPAPVKSFALAWLLNGVRRWTGGHGAESRWGRAAKIALHDALLEEWVREAAAADVPLLFVLLVPKQHVKQDPGWRETWLAARLTELGVPWVDSRALLRGTAAREDGSPRWFYGQDAHLNARGNHILARKIARVLLDTWPEHVTAR